MTTTAEPTRAPEDQSPGGSTFWRGLVIGLVLAPVVMVLSFAAESALVFVGYLFVAGFALMRRAELALGWVLGSIAGGLVCSVLAVPILMLMYGGEDFDVEPPSLDGNRVVIHPGTSSASTDNGFVIKNNGLETVIVRDDAGGRVELYPAAYAVVDVAECSAAHWTALTTEGKELGEQDSVCPSGVWQLFDHKQVTVEYVDSETIRPDDSSYLIVNNTDHVVEIRDGNGERLARITTGRAADLSVFGCANLRLTAEWPDLTLLTEQPQLCGGDTWYLNGPDDATLIQGSGN